MSGRGMAEEKALGKSQDARLLSRLWTYVAPHWPLLILSLLLVPAAVGFELIRPFLLKIAIDQYIAVGRIEGAGLIELGALAVPISGLFTVVLIYVASVGLWSLSSYAQLYALNLLGQCGAT